MTRAAQAVLTNDPKQRPLFTIFNTVGSLAAWAVSEAILRGVRSAKSAYGFTALRDLQISDFT